MQYTVSSSGNTSLRAAMGLDDLRALGFPQIAPVPNDETPRPFWSVAIPVYHNRPTLEQCINSVLEQHPGPEAMEILVVDTGDDKSRRDLVERIGRGLVRYLQADNRGMIANWNRMLDMTRGAWVHLLHDDDQVKPGFYEALAAGLQSAPEAVGVAFTGYETIDASGRVVSAMQAFGNQPGVVRDFSRIIGVHNWLQMAGVVVRRSTYAQIGVYHPDLIYCSDWEFYKRASCYVDLWYEPGLLARYRAHSDSETGRLMGTARKYRSLFDSIVISDRYFPPAVRDEVSPKARAYYSDFTLNHAIHQAVAGSPDAALLVMKEALRLNPTMETVDKVFRILQAAELSGLRRAMIQVVVNALADS